MKKSWLFFIFLMLPVAACNAEEQKSENSSYSLPFLIIDMDDDGVDLVPLEESQAYFDVDGDGHKEFTSWLNKPDEFFITFKIKENLKLQDIEQRISNFSTGGFSEILESDRDADNDYDSADIERLKKEGGGFIIKADAMHDYDEKGNFYNGNFSSICKQPSTILKESLSEKRKVNGGMITNQGKLICQNKTYPLYEVQFQYQDK